MNNATQIMREILDLTTEMETKYPELYKYLDETPVSITVSPDKVISISDLQNYLSTLKEQLQNHLKAHQANLTKPVPSI